jgi:hypothetical protein
MINDWRHDHPRHADASSRGKVHFPTKAEHCPNAPFPLAGPTARREAVPIVQQLFSFARPLAVRARNVRRPFRPSQGRGPYRLPHAVRDRLVLSLAPFRNREAAFVLAVFLARFWSVPGRVAGSFPIDRRALADHAGLDLTEARVRGAIRTLEAVGFLDRAILASGSLYKATPEGLHRKPVLFVFGPDYAPAFIAANARAAAARSRHSRERRPVPADSARRPSAVVSAASNVKSPKNTEQALAVVLMGELRSGLPPEASGPNSPLEAALDRLRRAAEGQGRFGTAPGRDS